MSDPFVLKACRPKPMTYPTSAAQHASNFLATLELNKFKNVDFNRVYFGTVRKLVTFDVDQGYGFVNIFGQDVYFKTNCESNIAVNDRVSFFLRQSSKFEHKLEAYSLKCFRGYCKKSRDGGSLSRSRSRPRHSPPRGYCRKRDGRSLSRSRSRSRSHHSPLRGYCRKSRSRSRSSDSDSSSSSSYLDYNKLKKELKKVKKKLKKEKRKNKNKHSHPTAADGFHRRW